mgnify:CR=1 FL=1
MSELEQVVATETPTVTPKKKRNRKPVVMAIYPEIPTSITAINAAYIKAFIKDKFQKGEITKEQVSAWAELTKVFVEEHGERSYFAPLRKEFVKGFFPELAEQAAKKQKKESMLDFLEALVDD